MRAGPLLTTNLVVAETHQLLLARTNRAAAPLFLGTLPLPRLEVVTSTAAGFAVLPARKAAR